MTSKEQSYEEEFDFQIVDDLQESKKPSKPLENPDPSLNTKINNSEIEGNTLPKKTSEQIIKPNDNLISLQNQFVLKSIPPPLAVTTSKNYSLGKDTLKYSNDSNLNLSSSDKNPLADAANNLLSVQSSSNNQMLISHTESMINNIKQPQESNNESSLKGMGLPGSRQPQRRLMRKPFPQAQSEPNLQYLVKVQEPLKEQNKQQNTEVKKQEPQKEIQIKVTFSISDNSPPQKINDKPSEPMNLGQKKDQDLKNRDKFDVLVNSLKSNSENQPNHSNLKMLPSKSLESLHHELPSLASSPLESKLNQVIPVKQQINSQNTKVDDSLILKEHSNIGQAEKINTKNLVPLLGLNIPLPQLHEDQMHSSITHPVRLGQVSSIEKPVNPSVLGTQNKNDLQAIVLKINELKDPQRKLSQASEDSITVPIGGIKKEKSDDQQDSFKGQLKIGANPLDDLLKRASRLNELQSSEKHDEQGIDSLIGLLNTGSKQQLLVVPSQQIAHSVASPTNLVHSVTNPINLSSMQPLQHSITKPLNILNFNPAESIQQKPVQIKKAGTEMACSILKLTQLAQELQKPIFAIKQLCDSTNDKFKCPKLSNSRSQSGIPVIKYYGYSWSELGSKDLSKQDPTKPKYNRDMLFGSKAKFMREIQKQEQEQKALTQKKNIFLYLQPNLTPLLKESLKITPNLASAFSVHAHFNFQQRVALALDLIETLFLVHDSDFMVFPQVLFPQKNDKTFVFAVKQSFVSISKLNNSQPQIKFGIHFLEPFKHLKGTSSNPLKLKEFINQLLHIQKENSSQQNLQKDAQKIPPNSAKKKIQTQLKSPQIRFYHEDWFWELWNKSVNNSLNQQTSNSSNENILNPKWVDLFQLPFVCLQLIFGQQIVSNLIQNKYQQILKAVIKIKPKEIQKPKEAEKKPMPKFDPTLLGKPQQQSKEKLEFASQLAALSILKPKAEQQIIRICQKPLITWAEYEASYKQFQQKHQKANQTANKLSMPKNSNQNSVLTNTQAKKIFEQISSWLSLLPFHEVSQGKYQAKRLPSLRGLYEKLSKFKVPQKSFNLVPPQLTIKKNPKAQSLVKKQGIAQQIEGGNDKKQTTKQKQKGLTIFSSQSASKALAELKKQYAVLLQSNKTLTVDDFQSEYIKKPETHLLTQQIKKKLSTAFTSHSLIMKSPKSFTLIYKASVFNFATRKFYQYCQNRERLFYVLKIRNQKMFFYYNEEKIVRMKQMNGLFGNFVKDTKGTSFLYTGQQVLKVKNANKAFAVSNVCGPIIGEGDIVIKEGNIDNECNYPKSYEAGKKTAKLTKSNKFVLEQMDVYEVSF